MESRIMDLEVSPGKISFTKNLNQLDRLALDFASILQDQRVAYVFVSGWVAIMLGRMRASDDVDVLIEELDVVRLRRLMQAVEGRFECVQTSSPEIALSDHVSEGSSIRFSAKGTTGPDVEVKFARKDHHLRSMADPIDVSVSGRPVRIGPLELQLAYKLLLGSEKDFEDARYIYRLMRDHLDTGKIRKEMRLLKVPIKTARAELGPAGWLD